MVRKLQSDPRVIVSASRHAALSKEADKRGLTIEMVAEEKFVLAVKCKCHD